MEENDNKKEILYRCGSIELDKQQLDDLTAAFAVFDQSGTGHVTSEDLKQLLRDCGQEPTEEEITDLMTVLGNSEGQLDFNSFVKFMSKTHHTQDEFAEIFAIFDQNGTGKLNHTDIRRALHTLGETLSEAELLSILTTADANGDGKVDYNEFAELMSQK